MKNFESTDFDRAERCQFAFCNDNAAEQALAARLRNPDTCWACGEDLSILSPYQAYCEECGVVIVFD